MKIRNGFVSNSSSSSFVVALPHKPKDSKDLKKMLFGDEYYFKVDDVYIQEYIVSAIKTEVLAKNIFNQMIKECRIKKASKKEINDSISNGYFYSYKDLPGNYDAYEEDKELYNKIINDKDYKDKLKQIDKNEREINLKRAKDIADRFMNDNKDKFIVVVEFSDNDGQEIEEHHNVFENVEHIRTSYH